MTETTLCYIRRGGEWLMLHRAGRENDENAGKWIGVGLFTADEFTGEVTACDEGELRWVPEAEVPLLPTWAGDRIFLNLLLEGEPFFHLSLKYEGETLVGYRLEA